MKTNIKTKILTTLIVIGLAIGTGAVAQSLWYPSSNYIRPVSSWGLQVTGLPSCNTIDTDVSGKFSCGTDANTTYTASGTLLDLTGTTLSVNEGTLTNTKGCKYVSGTGLVCDQDYLTSDIYWTGTSTNLVAATGRTSLGLGTMALEANTGSTTITTLGTISTGVWSGISILDAKIASSTEYLSDIYWTGTATNLVAATGRTSLGLGTMALLPNTGSSTITTVGTIGTGTWGATAIDISGYTNLAVGNGITQTDDTLTVTAAGGLLQAAGGLTTTGVLEDLNTLGAAVTDGHFIVATGAGAFVYEGTSTARTSIGLGNVENTALSSWAGTTNVTTLGTIATGVWGGTAIEIGTSTDLIAGTGLTLTHKTLDWSSSGLTWAGNAIGNTVGGTAADTSGWTGIIRTDSGTWSTTTVGSGDVTAVGDCASGACFDGTSDGGTYLDFYDAQATTRLIGGNIATGITVTLPTATGTLIYSGGAFHDGFSDFVANEHLDWTANVGTIDTGNYIENATHTGDVTGSGALTITATTSLAWSLKIDNETGTGLMMFNDNPTIATSLTVSDDDWIGLSSSEGRILFDTTGNDDIAIMDAFFGIGDSGPGVLFEVYKDDGSGKLADFETSSSTSMYFEGVETNHFLIGAGPGDKLSFSAGNTSAQLTIDTTGYLGIGTTSPSALLTVGATSTSQFLVSPLGVITDGVWNGTSIVDAYVDNNITIDLATAATALNANPTDCGANTWATTIAASGNLTCSAINYAGITATTSLGFAAQITDETGTGVLVFGTSPVFTTGITVPNDSISAAELNEGDAFIFTGSVALPQGAPTIDAAGEVGVDTTSDQFLYYGGAKRVLSYEKESTMTVASSTLAILGGWDDANGTTTVHLGASKVAESFTDIYCFTDAATTSIRFGDGTNWMDTLICGIAGQEDDGTIANNTFTAREKRQLQVFTKSGSPNQVSITVTKILTAD